MEALISALEDENRIPSKDITHESNPSSGAVRPLEENILAILWELHYSGMSHIILGPWVDIQCGTIQDFVTLLSFAATFEVKSAKVSSSLFLIILQLKIILMKINSMAS